MMTKSIKLASEGQKAQIAAVVAALAKELVAQEGIDREGAQKILAEAPAFKAAIRSKLAAALRAHGTIETFAREEITSLYRYLAGYKKARPAEQQMAILTVAFPGLRSYCRAFAMQDVLVGTEGNFLIPDWRALAPTYNEAVEIVLAVLQAWHKKSFINHIDHRLGPSQLKESAKKAAAFQGLRDEQAGHDVLVVQAQFGIQHRGKSVRRARFVMGDNEFALGTFEIACMLLTHQDRLRHRDDLWIYCAGDEFAPVADGVFSRVPYFFFYESLELDNVPIRSPYDHYGSPSAFTAMTT